MTYRKDLPKLGLANGGLSGKLSWNLGKRFGELASLTLPRDDDENNENYLSSVEKFWEGLEAAANRLIQQSSNDNGNTMVTMKRMDFGSEDEALAKFGDVILDAGQLASREKRIKKERKAAADEGDTATATATGGGAVSVGQLLSTDEQLFSVALLHGDNLVPFSSLGQIKILRENPKNESNIVCNKKKCEVTIKFCVVPPSTSSSSSNAGDVVVVVVEQGNEAVLDATSIEESKAMSKEIRLEEGTNYELWRQQLVLEAAAVSSSTTAQEEGTTEDKAATAPPTTAAESNNKSDDMVVTAFEVAGSIDYNKLIEQFGSKELTPYLLRRLENVTVKQGTVDRLHRFLRREIFFSHRDIEKICELLEGWYGVSPPPMDGDDNDVEMTSSPSTPSTPVNKPTTPCPIYLYTGRGPSSAAMHLGHLVPFLFTAWLQKAFQCPLVIQMTDDEKFIFKGEYTSENSGDGSGTNGLDPNRTGDNLDYFAKLTIENAKDIIACDFIPEKTFLFSDLDYVGRMYPNIVRIWKAVTVNQVNGVFGFDSSANIGKTAFPAIQAAPSFGSSFPNVLGGMSVGGVAAANPATLACLIPCAIDQDPYFRLTRDIAHKLVPSHHPLQGKPSLIHSKFFPPLQGAQGKMSSSDANSAIFLTDTPEDIERKIKQHAFSGGQDTKKLQEELGANLDVDVSYQWLRFFLEDDDELIRIGKEYGSGSGEFWSTGKVKAKLVSVLKDLVQEHQERRNLVTDEVVKQWMTERCIL
jgi:tryptophanyl-tRNA synthetase